jgi:hypothetical protein
MKNEVRVNVREVVVRRMLGFNSLETAGKTICGIE